MIDALQVRPPDKDKSEEGDSDGGGGGGGGGSKKPKIPSEVELRLMQARQKIINNLTKVADAMKERQKSVTTD